MPQAAILGIHAIKEKPVVVNGEIVIRPIMVVALTYDHRLLDGREAVTMLGESLARLRPTFRMSVDHDPLSLCNLVRIKEYIEDPARMLLEPKA
jgi:2-oxoglutarate dehydrogenase E2 component (dihydrolipoamide succinyltransferase)